MKGSVCVQIESEETEARLREGDDRLQEMEERQQEGPGRNDSSSNQITALLI